MAVDQANFHQLLSSILSTDNDVRQQAEDAYNSLPRDVKITHLLGAIHNHQQPEESRQIAAVLLRRLFTSEFTEFYKEENIWNYFKHVLDEGSTKERYETLITIKNAVIGSNRQKGAVIDHGLVPYLFKIAVTRKPEEYDLKLNALIIIGSLVRGTKQQMLSLVEQHNIIRMLTAEIFEPNNNKKCIEICLNTMRSIYENSDVPLDQGTFINNPNDLTYLLSLGGPESSLKIQTCVTSLLVAFCKHYDDQMKLLNAGTINTLARMIYLQNEHVQIPALHCLTCMCYENRAVADTCCVTSYHGRSLPDILNGLMSRLCIPEVQLTAAKCLTNVYRAGTLPHNDHRIMKSTLPTLTRLCTDTYETKIRGNAAETLAYLTEINSELQHIAAISHHLLKSLKQLLQNPDDYSKRAALKCFATLGANDEAIRKRIIDAHGLVEAIVENVNDENCDVKLAALKSLLSLSRSVHQLRTTFQDFAIWKPLMELINCEKTDIELLVAATSIICNLVLEFSPSKVQLLQSGIIEKLCSLLSHQEYALRLNCIWALMNMSYNADPNIRLSIITTLTTKKLLELLQERDKTMQIKALALVRNILCTPEIVETIMSSSTMEIADVLYDLLQSSNTSNDIKEQVLCIIGNIVSETENASYVIKDDRLLRSISNLLKSSDSNLQAGALFVFNNILRRKGFVFDAHYSRLSDLHIIEDLYEMQRILQAKRPMCKSYIHRTLNEIIEHCQSLGGSVGAPRSTSNPPGKEND